VPAVGTGQRRTRLQDSSFRRAAKGSGSRRVRTSPEGQSVPSCDAQLSRAPAWIQARMRETPAAVIRGRPSGM
jgi:hypothetical protein